MSADQTVADDGRSSDDEAVKAGEALLLTGQEVADEVAGRSAEDSQVVFLIGSSYGAHHGARRTVTKARAAEMVRDHLASYPASYIG